MFCEFEFENKETELEFKVVFVWIFSRSSAGVEEFRFLVSAVIVVGELNFDSNCFNNLLSFPAALPTCIEENK